MFHCRFSHGLWSCSLAGLVLGLVATPGTRAGEPDTRSLLVLQLQMALYELREVAEDCHEPQVLSGEERRELVQGINASRERLKGMIGGLGAKVEYTKPPERPKYPDNKHLRHAAAILKTAKEHLKSLDGIHECDREKWLKEIEKTQKLLEKTIDRLK